jgi:four helix bundle protein
VSVQNADTKDAIKHHRDLVVWQRAVELAVACYRLTDRLPPAERHGLSSQVRRAAVSVPANIAEGHGRGSSAGYARCLAIARGSLMEVETHLIIAERLRYFRVEELDSVLSLSSEVGRILNGLIRRVQAHARASTATKLHRPRVESAFRAP